MSTSSSPSPPRETQRPPKHYRHLRCGRLAMMSDTTMAPNTTRKYVAVIKKKIRPPALLGLLDKSPSHPLLTEKPGKKRPTTTARAPSITPQQPGTEQQKTGTSISAIIVPPPPALVSAPKKDVGHYNLRARQQKATPPLKKKTPKEKDLLGISLGSEDSIRSLDTSYSNLSGFVTSADTYVIV